MRFSTTRSNLACSFNKSCTASYLGLAPRLTATVVNGQLCLSIGERTSVRKKRGMSHCLSRHRIPNITTSGVDGLWDCSAWRATPSMPSSSGCLATAMKVVIHYHLVHLRTVSERPLPSLTLIDYYVLVNFQGPWFRTQLALSASIGIVSFLLFSYCRTRWPLLFAPRTKLKGSYAYGRSACHLSPFIQVSLHTRHTHTRLSSDG